MLCKWFQKRIDNNCKNLHCNWSYSYITAQLTVSDVDSLVVAVGDTVGGSPIHFDSKTTGSPAPRDYKQH